MKKFLLIALLLGVMAIFATPMEANAQSNARTGRYMGFSGGISEGRRLPGTTETIIMEQGARRPNNRNAITLEYREVIFLSGRPELFEGILEIRAGAPDPNSQAGTFTIEHRVRPHAGADASETSINRTMIFTVSYRRVGSQILKTYEVNPATWRETISTAAGDTFTLDHARSSFVTAIIEDQTPGVSYYRGNVSARMFFTGSANGTTIVEQVGTINGFTSAWSATETHRMDFAITNDNWALTYQIRPSVTVNKVLQFESNEPFAISFEGNFMELHQSFAGLRYDIFIRPQFMWDEPLFGSHSLETFNVFEQLFAPDLSFMRGHPAEDDIHRLFAMEILTGEPQFFIPEQGITRGQFMTALARAIKLPVQEVTQPRGRTAIEPVVLFNDVNSDRPEFRYIQAIVDAGVAEGREGGSFHFDYLISRQEAITTIIRALGLTNIGLNPTVVTPFVDSNDIASWAMRDISVANTLGLISPDINGNLHPNRAISNAEAATLLNHLIDYLREGIVRDYADHIVNTVV
ncbi:MAG: S-layer homology domain-containing protein [Defluviitaleaceae bacterium]|nr:S-layer homology domain-containing protein [Defluviitaleaceae bacterium]